MRCIQVGELSNYKHTTLRPRLSPEFVWADLHDAGVKTASETAEHCSSPQGGHVHPTGGTSFGYVNV